MITIVGLGNPGTEYETTRHNIGWMLLFRLVEVQQLPKPHESKQCAGLLSEGILFQKEVGIVFPTTFMNNSGGAVQKYLTARKSTLEDVIVVHDDIDLPFGEVRISYDRGAGGHNGIRSIVDVCGSSKFTRIRVGIAHKSIFGMMKRPTGDALSKFVLGTFTKRELEQVGDIYSRTERALRLLIEKGREAAMQEINAL